ncbi:MAG: hypothetical protein IPL08_13610 [Saprospiraceae bacterium]|nr:hypothetical protein [Saprospiraceae bacterium]
MAILLILKTKLTLDSNPTSFPMEIPGGFMKLPLLLQVSFYIDSDLGNSDMTTALAAITNIINMDNVRYNQEMAIHFYF